VEERTGELKQINEELQKDIIERKKAETEIIERAKLSKLNADIGSILVGSDTLPLLLQKCAKLILDTFQGAFSRIWTLNEQEQVLELKASAGLYTHLNGPHGRIPVGGYKIGLIVQERKPHLTNQVIGDPRVSDQEWAQREGMVSFAGYPLLIEDRVLGVLAMFSRRPLLERDLQAMGTVSTNIALAVNRKWTDGSLEEERRRLQKALDEVRTLSGILPICSYCKKVRNDEGYWDQVEMYVSSHTDAKFSHGICPTCFEREMEEWKS
jgi:GAF domain-containing protein